MNKPTSADPNASSTLQAASGPSADPNASSTLQAASGPSADPTAGAPFDFRSLDAKALKEMTSSVRAALQMAAAMGGAIADDDKSRLKALEAEMSRRKIVATPAKGPDVFGTRG